MKRIRLLLVLMGVIALSVTGLSTASAETPAPVRTPEIAYVAPVAWVHGGVATVAGVYRCWGDSNSHHLWVSIKQGGPDPTAPGSSETVDAWFDTNASGDTQVVCNGRWQVRTVTLEGNFGSLRNGWAWVQFCLVPPGVGEEGPIASSNRWVYVVGAR